MLSDKQADTAMTYPASIAEAISAGEKVLALIDEKYAQVPSDGRPAVEASCLSDPALSDERQRRHLAERQPVVDHIVALRAAYGRPQDAAPFGPA